MNFVIFRRKVRSLLSTIYLSSSPAFHALRYVAPSYYRGKRSAAAYARYYAAARQLYRADGKPFQPVIASVYDVGAHLLYSPGSETPFSIDSRYMEIVERVSKAVEGRLKSPADCYFFPRLSVPAAPGQPTDDLPDVKNGDVITTQLRDFDGIDGLSEMCGMIIAALEQNVYGSYLIADKIYIYRSLVSRQPEQISWLWHYDNHPDEVLKVMVYLSDVDEDSGPFGYLVNPVTGRPMKMKPVPNLVRPFIETRISPRQVQQYTRNGYSPFKLCGKKGTTCLFSENIIHKANIANKRHRDVVVIQVRPVTFRPSNCISNDWTGSFQHVDVGPDPSRLAPIPKPVMASG
jgi:hypothetical protein